MSGQIVTAFHHGITRDQKFISGTREKGGRIIADSKGYPLRPNPFLLQEITDSPNEPKFSDITYPLRHVGQPPVNVEGIWPPPRDPSDSRPRRSRQSHGPLPASPEEHCLQ